mgnify:FL=1
MKAPTSFRRFMSRADAAAMIVFMLAGAGIALTTLISAVVRISEVLSDQQVALFARFWETVVQVQIDPDVTSLPVDLDTGWFTTATVPAVSVVLLVVQQVVLALGVGSVIACLLLVAWSVLRGRVFGRTTTRLVTAAGIAGLLTLAIVPLLGDMAASAAFDEIAAGRLDYVAISVDIFPLILTAFVAALATTVFTVGERLQRDTQGLV